MGPAPVDLVHEAVEAVYRSESRRVPATLIRRLGGFDLAEEARGGEMPPARITLSTEKSVRSDAAGVDQVLSEHFHRSVKLARAAPDDFTIDQYHPDIEGVDPGGNRDKFVEQKLGAALFAALGAPSPRSSRQCPAIGFPSGFRSGSTRARGITSLTPTCKWRASSA